ncbi:MAG: hypothetical protein AVDCRST_MAG15-513, partial [uncultured Rubellimicrobium sp.]
ERIRQGSAAGTKGKKGNPSRLLLRLRRPGCQRYDVPGL